MTPNTRQEAVELQGACVRAADTLRPWYPTIGLSMVANALYASGLLEANNQLRQRLTEAEGLLDMLADALRPLTDAGWYFGALAKFRAYRTKYTPEPPE